MIPPINVHTQLNLLIFIQVRIANNTIFLSHVHIMAVLLIAEMLSPS